MFLLLFISSLQIYILFIFDLFFYIFSNDSELIHVNLLPYSPTKWFVSYRVSYLFSSDCNNNVSSNYGFLCLLNYWSLLATISKKTFKLINIRLNSITFVFFIITSRLNRSMTTISLYLRFHLLTINYRKTIQMF